MGWLREEYWGGRGYTARLRVIDPPRVASFQPTHMHTQNQAKVVPRKGNDELVANFPVWFPNLYSRKRPSTLHTSLVVLQYRFHCTVPNLCSSPVHKAFVGLERGELCFENPVYPSNDGLSLLDYTGDCLTFEGEINKLAANVAIGR